eukprot:TRINITY_DN6335_c0_g1_i2.p1 TRINITY_DN6335_c0_g1~~TRINITY_DN6335_c0_g1_i2.p1  ORF type:complete len:330 (+),score=51.63 TRINITY_DN6335_c0_g1_i2:176-1165(+)
MCIRDRYQRRVHGMALCCCKFINIIFSIITFVVGVSLVVGGAYLLTHKPSFTDMVNIDLDKYYDPICKALICVGAFIIFSGVLGIYGSCTSSKCALSIYWFSGFILMIIFLALLIVVCAVAIPYYNDIKDNPTESNSKLSFLKEPNQLLITLTSTIYCKTYETQECKCLIKNQDEWTTTFKSQTFFDSYDVTSDESTSKVAKVSDCSDFSLLDQQTQYYYNQYKDFGEYLENQLECSGIFDPLYFYIFTDINRGIPKNNQYQKAGAEKNQSCVNQIINIIEKYKFDVILGISIASAIYFFNCIFTCYICCSEKKKKHQKNEEKGYYQQL